ncbi:hypothetical protein ROHU_021745 [Labeo rohita]|uniref:ribonuclease H n=1 Tax=Labeo rohita TaxID=84645 RepID=A0A498N3G9_LABRO|nr:hypothetical protein ROHU_021745 [Labeo rohita]
MEELRAVNYDDIKAAVLAKYNVTEETYRLQFRSLMVLSGETLRETYNCIKGLYRRWMRPETKTKDQMRETIILEQYLRMLHPDVRVWVKENQPQTGEEAARLAERYVAAHQEPPRTNKDSTPIRQKPYRVPEKMVEKLKTEVKMMLEMGIMEPSQSEWSSPILLVPKKDGGVRFCTDFRKLNSVSCFDSYPMPRIDKLIERLGKAHYMTTLDLCKGYWQVPLEPSCRPYTAFRTSTGLYQYTVMPFGLHGAPATFQRLMDGILAGCDQYAAAYLDDVVIYSQFIVSYGKNTLNIFLTY